MRLANGTDQMDDPNSFPWQVYGAVVTVATGAFAFLRWIFGERSRVLKERESLAKELRDYIQIQSIEMGNLKSVIARLNTVVDQEQAIRRESQEQESALRIELQTAKAALHDREIQIHELIRICRANGIQVPE